MSTTPAWDSVDNYTADLLELVADADPSHEEWDLFVACLRDCAESRWHVDFTQRINPNTLRNLLAGRIKPQRVGAFTHRALAQGLVEYTGEYVTSTDTKGRNGGKPCRELRWVA